MASHRNGSDSESKYLSTLPNNNIYVTGHNDFGQAKIQSANEGAWNWFPQRNVGFNVVYTTSKVPVDMNEDADIILHEKALESKALGLVQPGGTVCRIVDFGPQGKPLMHRTQSLDYGVVLEGVIEMVLDDGSVTLLKSGDVAVQRGTMHMWRNPSSTAWTRMLFVLQDSEPLFVNGEKFKENLGTGSEGIPQSRKDDH